MYHTPLLLRVKAKVTTEVFLYVFGYNFTRFLNLTHFNFIKELILDFGGNMKYETQQLFAFILQLLLKNQLKFTTQ